MCQHVRKRKYLVAQPAVLLSTEANMMSGLVPQETTPVVRARKAALPIYLSAAMKSAVELRIRPINMASAAHPRSRIALASIVAHRPLAHALITNVLE